MKFDVISKIEFVLVEIIEQLNPNNFKLDGSANHLLQQKKFF